MRSSSSSALDDAPAIAASASARSSAMRSITSRHPRQLVQRDGRRHRGVQRVRRDRDLRDRGRRRRRRPPAARRARRRRRASSRRSPGRASGAPVAGDERDALARQLVDAAGPRDRDGEDRAHRRAHGLVAERVGAARAERDRRGAERQRPSAGSCRRCRGRATPCRYTHSGPSGARPARLVDADRARARPEPRDGVQQRLLDLLAVQPAAGRAQHVRRRPARASAAATRSSPSATKRPRASRSRRRASLRISLSLSLWVLVMIMK